MDLRAAPRRRLLVLAAAAVVVAAFAVPALAQNDAATATPDDAATADDAPHDGRFAEARTAFAEALADELDLPVARVDEALTAVRGQLAEQHRDDRRAALEERLDAAVADGTLTREQADAILDAVGSGVLGRGGRRGHQGFGRGDRGGWFGGNGPRSPGLPEDPAPDDRA